MKDRVGVSVVLYLTASFSMAMYGVVLGRVHLCMPDAHDPPANDWMRFFFGAGKCEVYHQ